MYKEIAKIGQKHLEFRSTSWYSWVLLTFFFFLEVYGYGDASLPPFSFCCTSEDESDGEKLVNQPSGIFSRFNSGLYRLLSFPSGKPE